MSMDELPDLLAELEQGIGGGENQGLNPDVERIAALWLQEESSPEILPFQSETVQDLYELIENQQGFVDEQQSNPEDKMTAEFYQMELNRVKYSLRRYLKARLHKVEKHVLFITQDQDMLDRLSPQERATAEAYRLLLEKYAAENILGRLPANFQSLTEVSREAGSLLDEPDLDQFVFCRVKQDVGLLQVDDSVNASQDDAAATQDLRRGDVHVLKYRVIRPLVLADTVELI